MYARRDRKIPVEEKYLALLDDARFLMVPDGVLVGKCASFGGYAACCKLFLFVCVHFVFNRSLILFAYWQHKYVGSAEAFGARRQVCLSSGVLSALHQQT